MKQNQADVEVTFFYKYQQENEGLHFLSDKTSNDLNFERLFEYLDHTTSRVGQQYFYSKLRRINLSLYSNDHETITRRFSDDADLVLQTEKQLKKLNKQDAYQILSLFTQELPTASRSYRFLISILRFSPFTFAILLFLFHLTFCIYLLLISIVVNAVFHYLNKSAQIPFENSIPQLSLLLKCSHSLTLDSCFDSLSGGIPQAIQLLKPVVKASSLFRVEHVLQTDMAIVAWMAAELIRILTLSEPYLFYKTIRLIKGKQNEVEKLYCFVGEIDSLLAIHQIRESENNYCLPSVDVNNDRLSFQDLYHPLIESCVPNSLQVKDKSILLTGSNMSGKSTFIRSIGVNIIAAQNINTCFARQFNLKRAFILDSMITVSDDLMNSKSLFFEEVLTVKAMLANSSKGQNLFLLDEIFKGTNTLERIASAKAVLSELVKGDNVVFVSTHDIELAELLDSEYDLYHFCEHIQDAEVEFDYLLKPGRLTAFNAIKILQMSGYSDDIINEAYRTIAQLTELKAEKVYLKN